MIGTNPDPFTFVELTDAADARLRYDFDRAAAVMAALSPTPVSPVSLNPYRRKQARGTRIADIERQHRAHVAGGRHIEQVITMDRVINNA